VRVAAVDSRRRLWRSERGPVPFQLAWSADGKRLVALGSRSPKGPGSLRIFDDRGRLLRTISLPPGPAEVAFTRTGHRFALLRRIRGTRRSEVVLLPAEQVPASGRRIFAGRGDFTGLAWSPGGRWLLLAWASSDQWLFIRSGVEKVLAVSDIARQFDPKAPPGEAIYPSLVGWCCPPSP
jgi:hypothetical protein